MIEASKHYIVESVSGELLLISRMTEFVQYNSRLGKTTGLKVCKLVETGDKLAESTWEEIENLGDQTLCGL